MAWIGFPVSVSIRTVGRVLPRRAVAVILMLVPEQRTVRAGGLPGSELCAPPSAPTPPPAQELQGVKAVWQRSHSARGRPAARENPQPQPDRSGAGDKCKGQGKNPKGCQERDVETQETRGGT